jgi:hypothetical protein
VALYQPTPLDYDNKEGEKMKKITVVLIIVVVAAFLTATALGLQNGAAPENQESATEHPEFARDTAINYILKAHEELGALSVPDSWEMENLTLIILGASNLQYTNDGWTVNVSYPVVLEPTYTVDIEYTIEVSFQWAGTVSQNGNVVEIEFTVQ